MAETAMGSRGQLAWVREAVTWGTTPVTPAMRAVPIVSESLEVNIANLESAEIRPDRQYAQPVQGNIAPQGDINVEWNANALGYFLFYLSGDTPVITGTNPYTHTFQQTLNVDLPSVTLEKGFNDIVQYYRYPGARVDRVTIAVAPNAFVTGAIGWKMKNEIYSATPLDAALTDIAHVPLNSFNGTVSEGGAALATSTKFDLTIENQLMGLNVIGSQFLGALLAQRFRITGSLEMFFTDNVKYAKFRNFTETDIVLVLADPDSHSVSFDIKSTRYTGKTPMIPGEGPVLLTLPFSAYHDAVSGDQIEFIVINDQASLIT